jgi:hypothetical protein
MPRSFRRPSKEAEELAALKWNQAHPVGTPVTFWPMRNREGDGLKAVTTSEAWLASGDTAVIMLDKVRGYVALDHVALRESDAEAAVPGPAPAVTPSPAPE